MRTCSTSTVDQIRAMSKNITHPRYPAWVVTAAWDALHNRPMSAKRERRMCLALGIDPPPVMVETPACPDCGNVHNGERCHGQPVTVRLVRPSGTSRRKRYWRPCLPHNLTADQKRRIWEIAEE